MKNFSVMGKGPIINWLLRKKIAKSVFHGNMILLIVTLLCSSITIYMIQMVYSPFYTQAYLEDIPENMRQTLPLEISNETPPKIKSN